MQKLSESAYTTLKGFYTITNRVYTTTSNGYTATNPHYTKTNPLITRKRAGLQPRPQQSAPADCDHSALFQEVSLKEKDLLDTMPKP